MIQGGAFRLLNLGNTLAESGKQAKTHLASFLQIL
jgi:hypothetical protein